MTTLYLRDWRLARGLKQEPLAQAIGRDRSIISKIESGSIGYDSTTLEALAKVLNVAPGALFLPPPDGTRPVKPNEAGQIADLVIVAQDPDARAALTQTRNEIVHAHMDAPRKGKMPRDVPVFGTAAGSQAGAMQVSQGDAIDYVRRPDGLADQLDAYAVYIVGDSMAPAHPDGELRFVNPRDTGRVGDTVLVQVRTDDGEIETYIKILRRRRPDTLSLEQLNPPKPLDLPAASVVAVHKVLGMAELFGV